MTIDPTHDLDWLAFCYAAGELDPREAEAFEARLADDQVVREALARAVELTQVVAAAETQSPDFVSPAAHTNLDWSRRLSWMAVGGLASVLIALLWSGLVGPTWHTAQNRLAAKSHYQLAMAWNQARDEFAGVREAGLWLTVAGNDVDDETNEMAADDDLPEAPSWMTAAVFSVREAEVPNQPAEPNQRLENE